MLDKLFSKGLDMESFLNSGKETFENSFNTDVTIFVPVIFAGFFLGPDFTNRTLQQKIASGHSRVNIVVSKTLFFISTSAFIMLLSPIITTGIVTYMNGWGEHFEISYYLRVLVLAFLSNSASSSFLLLISFLCRDTSKILLISTTLTLFFVELGDLLISDFGLLGLIYKYSSANQISIFLKHNFSHLNLLQVMLPILCIWIFCLLTTILFFEQLDLN
ncbi:hypothetical protein, partial [Enterococcus sp. 3H8_DIV0648]|uniref:hypothetical protein n=2 Tax=Enterococcus TaxID=1350 RepID=UPI00159474DF